MKKKIIFIICVSSMMYLFSVDLLKKKETFEDYCCISLWAPQGDLLLTKNEKNSNALIIDFKDKKNNKEIDMDFSSAAWSPDGSQIAFLKDDKVHFWDVNNAHLLKTVNLSVDLRFIKWSPRDDYIAFCGEKDLNTYIYLFSLKDEKEYKIEDDSIYSNTRQFGFDFSPDGSSIIYQREEYYNLLKIPENLSSSIKVESYQVSSTYNATHRPHVSWASDGKKVALIDKEKGFGIYDDNLNVLVSKKLDYELKFLLWNPKNNIIASFSGDLLDGSEPYCYLELWQFNEDKSEINFLQRIESKTNLWDWSWSADGKKLATAFYNALDIWEFDISFDDIDKSFSVPDVSSEELQKNLVQLEVQLGVLSQVQDSI